MMSSTKIQTDQLMSTML